MQSVGAEFRSHRKWTRNRNVLSSVPMSIDWMPPTANIHPDPVTYRILMLINTWLQSEIRESVCLPGGAGCTQGELGEKAMEGAGRTTSEVRGQGGPADQGRRHLPGAQHHWHSSHSAHSSLSTRIPNTAPQRVDARAGDWYYAYQVPLP